MGVLTLMGSGEISPTMVKVHRNLLDRYDEPRAVFLDTPFGFQENADQITEKVTDYFATSLVQKLDVASLRSAAAAGDGDVLRMLEAVRNADYVFSGPGSPSYALRNWKPTDLAGVLRSSIRHGGAVTLASAAAVTAGTYAIPVYEVYKVGEDPHPLDGLDLLGWNVPTLVVPHFDNAEGGNHDTRFCYLGARRLEALRAQLPADTVVVGIDEHTALTIDYDAVALEVSGRGVATFLSGAATRSIAPGRALGLAEAIPSADVRRTPPPDTRSAPAPSFDEALRAGDADRAVDAILESEATAMADPDARARVRAMVVRLGDAARRGLGDPRRHIEGFVDALLEIREAARADRRWAEADRIRDRLVELGIEVNDGAEGTTWSIRQEPSRSGRTDS